MTLVEQGSVDGRLPAFDVSEARPGRIVLTAKGPGLRSGRTTIAARKMTGPMHGGAGDSVT